MFLDFYKLKEQPFGVTPDPRYLFLSATHREALASLFYGVKTGRGLMALIAPPGTGKTTLLFHFLEHLRHSARTAYLFQTQCDSFGLLRYLLGDLRVEERGQDFVAMHEKLNVLLLKEANLGRRFVLVIDESQNLEDSVLETARLLSDFETPRDKLLQIVFAGQSELADKLARPELSQLRQRIAILCRLEPLCMSDISSYVEHRLLVAGYKGETLFTTAAMESIAACTQGIPRNINNICFGALSLGCALRVKQIGADLIAEAAADLDMIPMSHERQTKLRSVVVPVSLVSSASTIDPECAVVSEVIEIDHCEQHIKQQGSEQASNRPLDDSQERLIDKPPYATGPSGEDGEGGTFEVELVGLELCEELADTFEALRAFAKPSFTKPQVVPSAIDCTRADSRADVANESASPDSRSGRQPSWEVRSKCGVREGGQLLRSFNATIRQTEPNCRRNKQEPFIRLAFVAAFVLASVAATSFRQDIQMPAAGFASYFSHLSIEPNEASPNPNQQINSKTTDAANGRVATRAAESAPTTQEKLTRVSRHAAFPNQGRQKWAPLIRLRTNPMESEEVEAENTTAAVIVQPGDDLRQICLRHLGLYNVRLLNRVSKLNPELTDPDRIEIGQRILLPTLGKGRSNSASLVRMNP